MQNGLLVHDGPTGTVSSWSLDLILAHAIDSKRLVRHEFVVVQLPVSDEEHHADDEETDSWRGPNPYQHWILDSGYDNLCDGAAESVLEEKNRHDDSFHVFRRAGISDFVGGDLAEALRNSAEHDHGELDPNRER